MEKTPYFFRNADGTFTFHGYFTNENDANYSAQARPEMVVDASFLYRTIDAAKDALNFAPLPEGTH